MTGESAERVATSLIEGLKNQPLALALLLLNVLFVGAGGYLFKTAIDRHEARAARTAELVKDCFATKRE